jgi:hypothetical protein
MLDNVQPEVEDAPLFGVTSPNRSGIVEIVID